MLSTRLLWLSTCLLFCECTTCSVCDYVCAEFFCGPRCCRVVLTGSSMQCLRGVLCVCCLGDGCTMATNAEAPHTTGVCTTRATHTTRVRSGMRTQKRGGNWYKQIRNHCRYYYVWPPPVLRPCSGHNFMLFLDVLVCVQHRHDVGHPCQNKHALTIHGL